MTGYGPYEAHPFADAFPLLEGEEFNELTLDIKRNGLRDPLLVTHDHKILVDGRNRYRACEAAGVDVVYETLGAHYTDVMLLDLIVSKNLARRQLNRGQVGVLALEYERRYAEAAKPSQGSQGVAKPHSASTSVPADRREQNPVDGPACHCGGDQVGHVHPSPTPDRRSRESSERAARAVGASGRTVQRAKAVQRVAPDLLEKVRRGDTALDAAYRQARERIRNEPKPESGRPGPVMLTLRTSDGDDVSYPQPQGKAIFNASPGEGISWAQWSWNPVTGCLHGCPYCYARDISTSERSKAYYPVGFTPLFHHERLDAPANTAIPEAHRDDPAWRRVFVCSMADLYGRWVPDDWIKQVHHSMLTSPEWEYILLTKLPARYIGLDLPPRAWVGTSVDEQKRVRIAESAFKDIGDVAVKWLSLEPLREPLEFTDMSMFDWVVIGAQTETRQPDGIVPAVAPPFEWVSRIVTQAKEAGCDVHMKPNLLGKVHPGSPGMKLLDEYPTPRLDRGVTS